MEELTRVCPVCNQEFKTMHPRKIYCCESHQRSASNKRIKKQHKVIEIIKCEECGREVQKNQPNQKFCSRKCGNNHWQRNHYKPVDNGTINCLYCGKEVKAHRKDKKFCSQVCLQLYKYHANKPEIPEWTKPKECALCGKTFTPTGHRQYYCSEDCRLLVIKQRKQLKPKMAAPIYKGTCPVCGEEFTKDRKNQVYCSTKCRVKYNTGVRSEVREQNKPKRINPITTSQADYGLRQAQETTSEHNNSMRESFLRFKQAQMAGR